MWMTSYLVRFFFPGVLCFPSFRNEGTSQPLPLSEVQAFKTSLPSLVLPKENGQGPHALFKLLSGRDPQGLESDVSRPPPDSRALHYMKRVYKMFATKEGVLKPNKSHLYNTVRLVTPHAECKHPTTNGDLHSMDLFFNLDCVTASEHLLKSAILFSLDDSVSTASNLTCVCNMAVQESDASSQVCIDVPHAMVFNLDLGRRRKWIKIDVTTVLHPWIVTKKRNLHMAVNVTCLKNKRSPNSDHGFFNRARRSLFLLLYTVDTSEHTYHRWNFFQVRRNFITSSTHKKGLFTVPKKEARKGFKPGRAPRHRREEDGEMKTTPVPIFNISQYYKQFSFPQNECELHSFWMEFSQLNWDKWIIAPHRYNPHFCRGVCPRVVGHRYGSPVHAVIQNIMREKLDSSVPELSCIPADYSPLSVLKVEADRSIVYQEYRNMIVKTCTCR
ncbi:growth/differentiation factor 9 [Ahaetulla prasina]|uniref:growth/differentiation factor 9 n=1 Tax=Ahaetulla prasina TaxID=499056 RepID=UPI002648C54B|nr:growth/differentiation factor 9 [Ahaetulla prasina]XP_058022677.1 growth/differentiation factor 9 [Ahaetulla prasina]